MIRHNLGDHHMSSQGYVTLLCSTFCGFYLLEPSKYLSLIRTSQLWCSTVIIVAAIVLRCSRILAWSMLMLIRFCLRNNANVVPPTVSAVSKKEPQENIARIAKRYLDDNMQQAWINPRLISMVSEYKCNDYASDSRTCAHPYPLYFLTRARARISICVCGEYARVLSEPANKLVCGGLPHWESFVINLLDGNARTLYLRHCTEVETRASF